MLKVFTWILAAVGLVAIVVVILTGVGGYFSKDQPVVVSTLQQESVVTMAAAQTVHTRSTQKHGTRVPRNGEERADRFRTCMVHAGFVLNKDFQVRPKANVVGGYQARVRNSVQRSSTRLALANKCADEHEHSRFVSLN